MITTRLLATAATLGIAASSFVSSAGAYFPSDFQYIRYQPVLPVNAQLGQYEGWPQWIGRAGNRYTSTKSSFMRKVTQIRTGSNTSLLDQYDNEDWPSWIGRVR